MSPLRSILTSLLLPLAFVPVGCDIVRVPGASPGEKTDPGAAGQPEPDVPAAAAQEVEVSGTGGRLEMVAGETLIDWDAARRDMAASSLLSDEASFQIASGAGAPPVPVFLPSFPAAVQGGEAGVRFQPVSDGYYAFLPGQTYDVVINGTNRTFAAPGSSGRVRSDEMVFQVTTTGAQVSFARYGADYLVEFECRVLVAGQPACIGEEEALAFAGELVISGTR